MVPLWDLTEGIEGKKNGNGGSRPPQDMGAFNRAVRANGALGGEVNVILDSGADLSVLPMSFSNVGMPLERRCKEENYGKRWW